MSDITAINKSIEYIDTLIEDQQSMIDTINTDHPDFIAGTSDEYDCWKMHDLELMKLERVKRQLNGLSSTASERDLAQQEVRAIRHSVIYEIGGEVEGAPTCEINYLQRLRELRRIEQEISAAQAEIERLNGDRDKYKEWYLELNTSEFRHETLMQAAKDINHQMKAFKDLKLGEDKKPDDYRREGWYQCYRWLETYAEQQLKQESGE